MTVRFFFQLFEPAIRERFAKWVAEAGDGARHLALELRDAPFESKYWRAEFCVMPPNGPVRITWAGIGSLWACAQGAVLLARRMSDGKRRKDKKLYLADDSELKTGLNLFELCQRLCRMDFPSTGPKANTWVDWAPRPEISPAREDSRMGNTIFFGALDWIMRHEIAHVTLQHSVGVDRIREEIDADRQATEWFRGDRRADPTREPSTRPGSIEMQLELRAIALGIGLIWVAMFEALVGHSSTTHPPSAERIFRCINLLELREDSMAAEVLADTVQAWIDPTGNWAPQGYPNAMAALNDALDRLYGFLQTETQMIKAG
jgi:hypothetical protein